MTGLCRRVLSRTTAAAGFAALLLAGVIAPAAAQSAEQIIRRMEENQTHRTARIEGRMEIRDRFGRRTSTFISWSEGADKALVEFTSPAERGQKVLRTEDEIYLYYPDAAELIRLQGAALRDSLLGSDVSYEDMTGNRGLLASYRVSVAGTETVNDRRCYVVELEARTRDVAYPRQKLWVDAEQYVMRRAEQYALSGRLLKVMEVEETMRRDGKIFPSRIVIMDQLKRNSRTEFIIEEAAIDVSLPPNIFSLEELRW